MRAASDQRGFTLMEILIAITIMGLVMASIGTAFSQLSRGAKALESGGKESIALGDALRWLGRDLEALYVERIPLYTTGESNEDPYRITLSQERVGGASVSLLRFTSLDHLPFGEAASQGVAEIVYFVTEVDGALWLHRSDRLFFHDPFDRDAGHPVMMKGVRAFQVVCIDADGNEQERWDSDSDTYGQATPVAVKVRLSTGSRTERSMEALFILRSVRKEIL